MAEYSDRPGYSFSPGPPPEASDFLKSKTMRPSFSWLDVEPAEHAAAFTVAKAMEADVLTAIREELQTALDEGLPFETFKKTLKPRLKALGWWGEQSMTDPATGELVQARLGSPRRLRTIYRANIASARSAGQWERIQRSKRAFPYLQYRLGPSDNHRDHHVDKNGLVLPVDDPFWDKWMPPNGWGCNCWTKQLTQKQAEALGIDVSPDLEYIEFRNKRTGQVKRVPLGIDPGWERNPGRLRMTALEQHLGERLARTTPNIRRALLRQMATSWRARRLIDEPGVPGRIPVAEVPPGVLKALDQTDALLHLPNLSHLEAHGRALEGRDLARLVDLVEARQIAVQSGAGAQPRIIFDLAGSGDGRDLHVIARATDRGFELEDILLASQSTWAEFIRAGALILEK